MARSLRPIDVFPITTRHLEVLRVGDVTPGMRRVTIGGPQLAAHVAENGFPVDAFRSDGFDDEFKIILKHPDAAELVGPTQHDGLLDWPRGDPHLVLRTYTVRRWDPAAGEIDVDFVIHGVGAASSWAKRVAPGEPVQIAGPKSSAPHPVGADWTLVAGDETALPAIGRWLELWPEGARGQVFIEIERDEHRQELPVPDGVELTWLSRDGAEAGTSSVLIDALKAAEWWDGTVFAWVAGEALTLVPIRRWLRNEKGLPKEQVEVTGYWRRQEVVVSEDDASVPDLSATEDEGERFHELLELVPGFALRVASSIELAAAFDGKDRTTAELAERAGVDPVGVAKLVRYLAAIGITERAENGRYRLTSLGRELEDDHHADELRLGGVQAQREIGGLLALDAAVRTGTGDDAARNGAPFGARLLGDPALIGERVEEDAEIANYAAGVLARVAALGGRDSIVVSGRGAGTFAVALTDAHASTRVRVVAAPSELAAIERTNGPAERVELEAGSVLEPRAVPAGAVLLTEILNELPDADAVHVLRSAAGSLTPGGAVVVFADVLDETNVYEYDLEQDLIDFALTGGGNRDDAEHRALFAAAGLDVAARETIGWGNTAYTLTPTT